MKLFEGSLVLDIASFSGIMLGFSMLLVSYFVPEMRVLAVPALILLFPSLVYGMR